MPKRFAAELELLHQHLHVEGVFEVEVVGVRRDEAKGGVSLIEYSTFS